MRVIGKVSLKMKLIFMSIRIVKDVQEGYISVGGIWQKWWPPPST